ncbi:MAG TPA: methyltransferase domain-containing protein [Polyangia bacterium]|nr:methyltransferase domain-containing protein [Polyangia bacterium]
MTPAEREVRLAKLYDSEVLPAYAARFATLLGRAVEARPGARVIEIGCATGAFTLELARRFDLDSHLTAFDASPAFLAEARARIEAAAARHAQVSLAAHPDLPTSIPLPDRSAELVVSNLTVATAADPRAAVKEAARLLVPGGQLALSAPLRGTWSEFLDLFRDVLRENGKLESLGAVDRYVAAFPDGEGLARWLAEAGCKQIEVTTARWEILFRSAREFFFAPLIELGPLAQWKRLSGRGDQMQDVFFFTKEAIDTYFKDRVFAVTIVGAVVTGRK